MIDLDIKKTVDITDQKEKMEARFELMASNARVDKFEK